ncbi:glycosyl hydrolase [Brevibacillus choshinensis]|uniref:Glycosyl hydrolase n=2 Tax=Brevibacillus choshinensis TaxID=54911 RepID=A0ABX7FXX2_BRECH|nr:glycosyl hydrolase [Brevibacillus choshinensis]
MKKQAIVLTVCLPALGAFLSGCGNVGTAPDSMKTVEAAEHPLEKTAWLVDWQWKAGTENFQGMTNGLASVQMFAAYFDESDNLLFTDEFKKGLPKVQEIARKSSLVHVDLTIVNDQKRQDGSDLQKEPTIVTRLMATLESRARHINQIMEALSTYHFHGVEIDYERIDEKDWDNMMAFINELYTRLQEQEKTLRIVLEPRTPIESLSLPKGPVYVMMAYNLYGTQSGPGPKADRSFIMELAARMKTVPGEKVIALAAGGFDWSESGEVKAVTEEQAAGLAKSSVEVPRRDNASGSIHFQYVDEKKQKHTVWYADETTLKTWANVISSEGYHNLALWRLGGLSRESVRFMNE